MTPPNRVILITGCSSGIGRALALELHRRGQRVIASARRIDSLTGLERGVTRITLDVNSAESIADATAEVLEREGRIDMLINNAGVANFGPLAELPLAEVRHVFETNVVGPLALTQAVFPQMATRNSGFIVNIGSMVGVIGTPFTGAYSASKAAVHMMSDVLRMELRPLGIHVIQVQPGAIRSEVASKSAPRNNRYASPQSFFRAVADQIEQRASLSQDQPMPAEEFARRLCPKLLCARPPARVRLGNGIAFLPILERLPKDTLGAIFSKRFGLSGLGKTSQQ